MKNRMVIAGLLFFQFLFGWGWLGGGTAVVANSLYLPELDSGFNVPASESINSDSSGKTKKPFPKYDPCETFILVIDRDPNHNSGPVMVSSIEDMGLMVDYMTFIPLDLSMYSLVFVCLGVYDNNHVLTSSEGQKLALYLNNGGDLYMEGGDTWYYDQPTAVHPMFNIYPVADGQGDLNVVTGLYGTFAQGMSFNYSGDNSWIDRINAIPPAYELFKNQYPFYITGVVYDEGSYKTIGVSHEFGGFDDGIPPSTKMDLMNKYLEFFGIPTSLQCSFYANQTEACVDDNVNFFDLSVGEITNWSWTFEGGIPANSAMPNPSIVYNDIGWFDVTLIVSDGVDSDTLIMEDYIQVEEMPDIPEKPEGPETVCALPGEISEYVTSGSTYSTLYGWSLEPSDAGLLSENGTYCTIDWTDWWQGEASLKVNGVNGCGESEYSEELNISCFMTGLGQSDEPSVKIYPNPSNGRFYLDVDTFSGKATISVFNILNEPVYSKELQMNHGKKQMIDLGTVSDGIYFIKFVSGNSEMVKRIIIH